MGRQPRQWSQQRGQQPRQSNGDVSHDRDDGAELRDGGVGQLDAGATTLSPGLSGDAASLASPPHFSVRRTSTRNLFPLRDLDCAVRRENLSRRHLQNMEAQLSGHVRSQPTIGRGDWSWGRPPFSLCGKIETSNVWNSLRYAPNDQCDDYKECGVYGICDNNLSPVCKFAKGFEPNNQQAWSLRDGSSGCVKKKS
ncbi:hypothetical protein RJ640_004025 [Escallonia rubra]|uniref:S-locus glycoprotein domain-containing protein n=1 Tax=Escallonia rubra TaxID=112253 RepID=A0AA88QVU5_9ASTE|nr:hypothetical protein RJ640_004025 [Escallonia rubra]